mgnify:CR=1 FL=1
MHVDDRLATVLHHRAAGERAARVQFRQLLDLLGEPAAGADPSLTRAAFRRLDALSLMLPLPQRERIAAECSARIRNPSLLAWFAGSEPKLALAALSRASLDEAQWTALIPDLPIRARGLLRHRRNLPKAAVNLLDRLGVRDRVLPEPDVALRQGRTGDEAIAVAPPLPALDLGTSPEEAYVLQEAAALPSQPEDSLVVEAAPGDTSSLSALVRRIEDFQRNRARRGDQDRGGPRLPVSDQSADISVRPRLESILFTTDDTGRIDWAEPAAATLVTGTLLRAQIEPSEIADEFTTAFAQRQPIPGLRIALSGADQITGDWIVEAAPRFAARSGGFAGYVGRLRRAPRIAANAKALRAADRIRQLLHELRTPVTAIQGFAEVIQQQTVGPVPHEYRALAAAIAGDAAHMLAGFSELERLARLETGTQELPEGTTEFVMVVQRQIAQLQTVLSPRVSRLEANWELSEARVALAHETAELLAWRFLGTLAAATAAGERLTIDMDTAGKTLRLTATLPAALVQAENVFAGDIHLPGGMLGTGLFGAAFALRLARAEARAAGGDLVRLADTMQLILPLGDADAVSGDQHPRAAERAVQ